MHILDLEILQKTRRRQVYCPTASTIQRCERLRKAGLLKGSAAEYYRLTKEGYESLRHPDNRPDPETGP